MGYLQGTSIGRCSGPPREMWTSESRLIDCVWVGVRGARKERGVDGTAPRCEDRGTEARRANVEERRRDVQSLD